MSLRARAMLKNFRRLKSMTPAAPKEIKPFDYKEESSEKINEDLDPLKYLERHSIVVKPTSIEEYIFGKSLNKDSRKRHSVGFNDKTIIEEYPTTNIKIIDNSFTSNDSEKENANTRTTTIENSNTFLPDLSEERNKSRKLYKDKGRFKSYRKFNQSTKLFDTIDELKSVKDLPEKLVSKFNKLLLSVDLPKKCIIDRDAKIVDENSLIAPIKQLSKEEILFFMKN